MILAERHIIKKSHKLFNQCDLLCFKSKNLYNKALYTIRQHYQDNDKKYLNYYSLNKLLKDNNDESYRDLPSAVSQQVLMILDKNYKSFFKLLKVKDINKKNTPKYKHKSKGRNVVFFTNNNACFLKDNHITFLKNVISPLKTNISKEQLKQVRIVPKIGYYIIEVIYDKPVKNFNLNSNNYCSIDLGVNNLMTLTSNVKGLSFEIINGKPLKSINQFYNKHLAQLKSLLPQKIYTSKQIEKVFCRRNSKIEHYLHHCSKHLIDYCITNDIGNVVIGYNEEWKQNINLGKITNQKFMYIPYSKLIQQITYKAELVGIKVILHEESYTSKCSALDLESIKYHKNYIGKRVKRGLFKTKNELLINSDVNGSLNILRKVIGNDFIKEIRTDRSIWMNARKIDADKVYISKYQNVDLVSTNR